MENKNIYIKTITNTAFIMLVLVGLLYGCNDYLAPEAYVKNGEAPPPLVSASVTSISGGGKIDFVLPQGVDDILYVKANFERNGKIQQTRVSRYDNSVYIHGLRDTLTSVDVQLIVGNTSGKESTVTTVQVKPLTSAIDKAIQSLSVERTFGGITVDWDNPTKTKTVVKVLSIGVREFEGDSILTEVLSDVTELQFPNYKVRGEVIGGFDSIPTNFGFVFKDIYDNSTDTLFITKTPIYEQYLQPIATNIFPWQGIGITNATAAAADPTLTWDGPNWGDRASHKLWDGKWRTNPDAYWAVAHDVGNFGGIEAFKDKKKAFVTIDLQKPSKLSRYLVHGLDNKNYVWNESAPRRWRIWVTPDLTEDEAAVWGPDSNWEVAHDFSVPEPFDGAIGHNVTSSDFEVWKRGWEHDLSSTITYPVRFVRMEVYEAWNSAVGGGAIGELQVFGAPQ